MYKTLSEQRFYLKIYLPSFGTDILPIVLHTYLLHIINSAIYYTMALWWYYYVLHTPFEILVENDTRHVHALI